MMFNEGYQDRILVCRDCNNEFTFTAGEQEFYARKGLTNEPGRCPTCRSAHRSGQQNISRGSRDQREQHEAICAACGRQTTVPFVPREDRPVYCSDCFQSQRAARGSREEARSYSSGNSNGNGRGRGGRDRYERRDRW